MGERMKLQRRFQKGETLIGILASLLILSIALSASVTSLMSFSRKSIDHRTISEANDTARMISDLIGYEIRMIGAGMPLWQGYFQMTDATLGTAPLPVLTSSTSTSIAFRLNEKGRNTVVTAAFNPASSNSITVMSTTDFQVGDAVYLSDATVTGQYGFYGTVSSLAAGLVTVNASSKVYTTGATFPVGSTADPVRTVTYTSSTSGITRNVGTTTSNLSQNATFSLRYLDNTGTALTLPLTAAVIDSSLYSIELTVSVTNPTKLSSGSAYTSTLTNRYALRNLNIGR